MNLYYTGHLCSASTAPPDRVWRVYKHEDIQARDLKMGELVGALPHEAGCQVEFDYIDGEALESGCNCPRGQLLAMLKETTNGPY